MGSRFNPCTNKRIKQKRTHSEDDTLLQCNIRQHCNNTGWFHKMDEIKLSVRLCLPVTYNLAHVPLCFSVIYLAHKDSDPLHIA